MREGVGTGFDRSLRVWLSRIADAAATAGERRHPVVPPPTYRASRSRMTSSRVSVISSIA